MKQLTEGIDLLNELNKWVQFNNGQESWMTYSSTDQTSGIQAIENSISNKLIEAKNLFYSGLAITKILILTTLVTVSIIFCICIKRKIEGRENVENLTEMMIIKSKEETSKNMESIKDKINQDIQLAHLDQTSLN